MVEVDVKVSLFDRLINFCSNNQCQFPKDAIFAEIDEKTLGITKWQWDYQECEAFQLNMVKFIHENPQDRIFIFCNHPPLFTLGSGLQKDKGEILPYLKDVTEKELESLTLPLHRIKRGGGLTFHHPGQWIFYPITKIGGESWSLSKHFDFLMNSTAKTLNNFFLDEFMAKRETAGIWFRERKVASIGIGVEKFVTIHGLALNLYENLPVKKELMRLHPCGLPPQTYTSVETILQTNSEISKFQNLVESFHREYLRFLKSFLPD